MGRNYSDVKGNKNPNYSTGFCVGRDRPSFYNSWQNLKARCGNPNHPKYYRYGGRGIAVCPEWLDIKGFSEWAFSSGWKEGLTIDRIDIDGNYCPENCRWVTQADNSRRKSTTKITLEQAAEIRKRHAEGACEYELAREYNVVHGTIWFVVNRITHIDEGECSVKVKEIRTRNKEKIKDI